MNIKVVDFEILSRHYVKYQEGIKKIEQVKEEFVKKLDPFRDEMQELLKTSMTADEATQKASAERFQILQEEGMQIDEEFKHRMRQMNDELSKEIYNDLERIITEWASTKDVDMVIGSTEVVFLKQEHYITSYIIDLLKERELYIDGSAEVKANVIQPTV
jgi:Skp family chaperone for outer membrane proteins